MVMADTNDNMEVTAEGEKRQKPENEVRHRKKRLYQALRAQMEFYFSDANLSKDRFLSHLVERDKYIDLQIFLRFNKIRSLTLNISDIAKALRDSELLSITEDGTKVYRTTPVKYKENEDECTIYVEQLPPDADHEWLKRVFSSYGEVVYVSIPKYNTSKKIKGFAFVEFDTPEAATKTLEAFGAMGCRLPAQMPPDNLCSIATFEPLAEDNENVADAETTSETKETCDPELPMDNKKRKLDQPDSNTDSETGIDTEPSKKKRKKKLNSTESEETLQEDAKDEETSEPALAEPETIKQATKRKSKELELQTQESDPESKEDKVTLSSDVPVVCSADELDSAERAKKQKQDILSGDECEMDSECAADVSKNENTTGETKKKKKNRNRNHKKKMKRESDPSNLGLKILSKCEWKRLRNKYLNLQRNKMKAVKQHLARARWSGQTPRAHSEDGEMTPNPNPQQPLQQLESARIAFTPGVIARVVLDEPVMDVMKFKGNVRAHADVQYVEILQGANEAFVRFSNSSSATKFAKEEPFGSVEILTGEKETNYWNKIMQDRTAKFSKKVKVKQRGRDKLLKRVERELGKHIRFDE